MSLYRLIFRYRKNKKSGETGAGTKAHPVSVMARSANMFTIVFGMVLLPITDHSMAEQAATSEPIQASLAKADPAVGEKVFLQCKGCHTIDKTGENAIGPNLRGVLGRRIGSAPDYKYSTAMTTKEDSWGFESLDVYLSNPGQFVPNTQMAFPGIQQAGDRANVIAYLRGLDDDPLPLPADSKPAGSGEVIPDSDPNNDNDLQKWNGLPPDPGREQVFYTCQVCHSLRIVQQQALSRSSWDETLEWMVEEQGMQEPDAKTRQLILNYLSRHFGPAR
jgi:cytochrome c